MAKIRVTETKVWEYEPDYTESWYQEAGVSTLEQALKEDQRCYEELGVTMDEITGGFPETSATWQIVD